jgi:CDP-paratose 2-epimerase
MVDIGNIAETRPADVKWYITDNGNTENEFGWQPKKPPKTIISDIYKWLSDNEQQFKSILGN